MKLTDHAVYLNALTLYVLSLSSSSSTSSTSSPPSDSGPLLATFSSHGIRDFIQLLRMRSESFTSSGCRCRNMKHTQSVILRLFRSIEQSFIHYYIRTPITPKSFPLVHTRAIPPVDSTFQHPSPNSTPAIAADMYRANSNFRACGRAYNIEPHSHPSFGPSYLPLPCILRRPWCRTLRLCCTLPSEQKQRPQFYLPPQCYLIMAVLS